MPVLLHFLIPQSRKHAYIQIAACIIIIQLNPGILVDWHYFLLTLLIAALATGPVRGTLYIFATAGWQPSWTVTLDWFIGELQWHTRLASSITGGVWSVTRNVALFCIAACVYALSNASAIPAAAYVLCVRGVEAARYAGADKFSAAVEVGGLVAKASVAVLHWAATTTADVAYSSASSMWTSIHWFGLSSIILLSKLAKGEIPETEVYLLQRRFRLAVEAAAETTIDVVESYHVRLVWVLLCITHFLSFTLGLTVILPCLFMYGAVVSFVYVAARRGYAGLICKVLLSWVNL